MSVNSNWDPEAALRSLVTETQVMDGESPEQTMMRLFKENGPIAALSICQISQHSPNERLRLDASKYVMDRVLGRIGDADTTIESDPLEDLLSKILATSAASN